MTNPRKKLFNVRFGGELLYVGAPLVNDLPPLFLGSDTLKKELLELDGVRKVAITLKDGELFLDLLISGPEFCPTWAESREAARWSEEGFDPLAAVEGDLVEGGLDALHFLIDNVFSTHLADWEFLGYSDVTVSVPGEVAA